MNFTKEFMEMEINLATVHQKTKKESKKLLMASIIFLVSSIVVALVILIITFVLTNTLSNLSSQKDQLVDQINAEGVQKNNALILHDRLSQIQDVLRTRQNVPSQIEKLLGFIPQSFQVNSMDAQGNSITFELVSNNLKTFDDFLDNQLSGITQNRDTSIQSISLSEFSLNTDTGDYDLKLNFVLKQ